MRKTTLLKTVPFPDEHYKYDFYPYLMRMKYRGAEMIYPKRLLLRCPLKKERIENIILRRACFPP